jgi:hypothetical protein
MQGLKNMKQATATARRMAKQRRAVGPRAISQGAVAAERRRVLIEQLRRSLDDAVSRPVVCHPRQHVHGKSVFFESNWESNGKAQVVFICNSVLPNSGAPVAALLWTDRGMEQVDFVEESIKECCRRGRLFLFPGSVLFEGGVVFAVVPANHIERQNGPPGLWTFATAGLYRDSLFITGKGGTGTFARGAYPSVLVTRPQTYDPKGKQWIWTGRSSETEKGRLRVAVELALERGAERQRILWIPPAVAGGEIAVIGARHFDLHGDPVGLLETKPRPAMGIVEDGGKTWFLATPNRKDSAGRLLFTGKAKRVNNKDVFPVPFNDAGHHGEVLLPANYRDTAGVAWFAAFANARRGDGLPLIRTQIDLGGRNVHVD